MRCALALLLLSFLARAEDDHDARMRWWREARFGLFIHWGLYAVPAGEWQGRTTHGEWIMHTGKIPVPRYEKFRDRFNPVRFDAKEWAKIAKDAGMRYIVITSKHHDGFCLFDSKHTDYDVMATPFRRDILKELAGATRAAGLKIGWYHSIMDWHHPDYLPRRNWEKRSATGANYGDYVTHLRNQVTELLTNYGEIGVLWFDGQWEGTWTHEHGAPLYELCRKLQPAVIVNNRVDKGGGLVRRASARFRGDFGTPEQRIPQTGIPGVDWETCMTMNRHWGWNKNDDQWKSTEDLIRKLVDIASKGGNFLLNVGPKADGTFPQPCLERLAGMGRWLKGNGEAIYGTQAGPFPALPWGRCTQRPNGKTTTLYLHVFDWPADGQLVVPGLGSGPLGARLLGPDATKLAVTRDESAVRIAVPRAAPDKICSVVALEIDGRPVVYEPPSFDAPSEILVRPLKVTLKTGSPDLVIRYTLDGSRPTPDSPRYRGPLVLKATSIVKARSFFRGRAVSEVAEKTFRRVEPAPGVAITGLVEGLDCEDYEGDWNELPDFAALKPAKRHDHDWIDLEELPRREYVGRRLSGYLEVPMDDVYLFALTSDDGSRLRIGDRVVIDNDGLHGTREKRGTIALAKGLHRIEVTWFNKTGGAVLEVKWAWTGGKLQRLGLTALRRVKD